MFEIFVVIVLIVLFIMLVSLKGRVTILERQIKGSLVSTSSAVQNPSRPLDVQNSNIDSSLLDFIRAQLKQSVAKSVIVDQLTSNGWTSVDIESAFRMITSGVDTKQAVSTPTQMEPNWSERFAEWIKEDWLMKIGALLLLIGFGWLTSYAFIHEWIGPMGRIALGIIAGALFIILGWWRIQKYIHQGGVFMVIGSTVILLTVFAARELYGFFTPATALMIMFLSTAFVALASVKYNSRALALSSIILAGFAPLLTGSQTQDNIALFSYLLVVTLGTVWIVFVTGRRELTLASLIIVALYSLPHMFTPNAPDTGMLLFFGYIFSIVFFITNTAGIIKLKDKDIMPDLITAAGTGLFLILWIMSSAPEQWRSLILSAWMIVFVVGAFITYKITNRKEPFLVYTGVGVAMLAAATSAELSGATLIIAYTIETTLLSLVSYIILNDSRIASKISYLLVVPVVMSVGSVASSSWNTGVIHKDFFVLFILGLVMLGLGAFYTNILKQNGKNESDQTNSLLLIVGSIYAYVLLWLSLHAAFDNDDQAVMASLFIYTLVGIFTYFYGQKNNMKSLKAYGGVVLGFVVARLLLVDVWNMELSGRIVTFFLMGALLVSTAFLGKRRKAMVDNAQSGITNTPNQNQ